MSSFKPLQPKRALLSTPTTPPSSLLQPSRPLVLTSSLLRPSRPLVPTSPPASEPVAPPTQEQLERAARLGHSFERISIFPPEKKNSTGLPDTLKTGIENLSGISLDDVHVHYNSPKPTEVQALAYTQGTDIHVGPGQEQYLAHETWHVVQQMQRRVKPTLQLQGAAINNDAELEREADAMGARANWMNSESLQRKAVGSIGSVVNYSCLPRVLPSLTIVPTIQRTISIGKKGIDEKKYEKEEFAKRYDEEFEVPEEDWEVVGEIITFLDSENHRFDTWQGAKNSIEETLNLLKHPTGWVEPIRALATEIVKNYPANEYYYIGLGRSPSAIIQSLISMGHIAFTIPLGGMKLRSGTLSKPVIPELSEEERVQIKNLIQQHLGDPQTIIERGKRLLLLDYTQSGEGLGVGQQLLQDFMGIHGKVVPLALQAGGFVNPKQKDFEEAKMKIMVLPGSVLEEGTVSSLIGGEKLKPFSPFYKLSLAEAKTGKKPQSNPLTKRMEEVFNIHEEVAKAQDYIKKESMRIVQATPTIPSKAGLVPIQLCEAVIFELDHEETLLRRVTNQEELQQAIEQVKLSRQQYFENRLKDMLTSVEEAAVEEKDENKSGKLREFAQIIRGLMEPVKGEAAKKAEPPSTTPLHTIQVGILVLIEHIRNEWTVARVISIQDSTARVGVPGGGGYWEERIADLKLAPPDKKEGDRYPKEA